jgi:dipeptidyl aminopeptidase/acylaminoacyl peptidase
MQQFQNIKINGSKEKPILLDVCYKANEKPKALVIFAHGFKGFKDWGHFNLLAKTFAESGFIFVKFNFSHNGTTPENPSVFNDLEAFGNNNYIIELEDLKLVIDWALITDALRNEIDTERLFLLGHSRGGGIAVIKAAEDKRVKKLVTWAAVSDIITRNKKRTIETWEKEGVVYTTNARTKQQMPLYYQFYKTILDNKDRLHITRAAKRLKIPYLIIHGTADEAVALKDAEDLHKACKQSELFIVNDSGHTFEVKHPFEATVFPKNAQSVIDKTIAFFKSP